VSAYSTGSAATAQKQEDLRANQPIGPRRFGGCSLMRRFYRAGARAENMTCNVVARLAGGNEIKPLRLDEPGGGEPFIL
jgi:hypothetical protein